MVTLPNDQQNLFRLLKLLRLHRLMQLLNVENFKDAIKKIFEKRLDKAVAANITHGSYPIMTQMFIVYIYRIFRLIVIIFTVAYFIGILWYIYVAQIARAHPEQ